jgi:hypothetical protein
MIFSTPENNKDVELPMAQHHILLY